MAILGGSPLGLIGVLSTPVDKAGMSSFNGGRSRNVNVNFYNVGKEADKEKLSKSGKKGGMFSTDSNTNKCFLRRILFSPTSYRPKN